MAKILVVDDEQILTELYQKMLEDEGYEVKTASDGQEALNVVEEFKPDLVVMDVKMPHLSGIETLKKLKAKDETKHIPVMMLTNQSEVKIDAEEAIKLGAVSYLVKADVVPADVIKKIREILGGYVSELKSTF